tara:strand:+ start:6686 stop:7972 length:1287 start_codon:yes stop_codon:yes gene_type:complete
MRTKVFVRGPVLSRSGYGEHARFILRSLRSQHEKFDIYVQNINWGQTGWIFDDNEEREWIDRKIEKTSTLIAQNKKPAYDMSIQVTIPQEFENLARVNIGATAGTETTRISPQWIEKSNNMNKIIFVSNHAKSAFKNSSYSGQNAETGQIVKDFRCTIPMDVVNYPVRIVEPSDAEYNFDYDFNFLIMAQYSPRKNLEKTIEWLVEEFYDREVGIILKMNLKNDSIIDRHHSYEKLKQHVATKYPDMKCKLYLLHGTLSEGDMSALFQHPKVKAMVNIAHGEGFGLPIFEAAYYGLPVICPEWGGQLDFLHVPVKNKKGKTKNKAYFAKVDYDIKPIQKEAVWEPVLTKDSSWCYPKQGSFKMKCREVVRDYKKYKKMAETLRKHILKNFKEEDMYEKFVSCIEEFVIPSASQEEVDNLFAELVESAR